MWQMSKMQREAAEAAWLERQEEERRQEAKRIADKTAKKRTYPSEWDVKIEAWEKAGIEWLRSGEELLGPRYDYEMELGRVGRFYSVERQLPYENFNAFGVFLYAAVRTIALHGLFVLVLSLVALIAGLPLWLCAAASIVYVVWRFRQRRDWILLKRTEAHDLRAGIFPLRGIADDAK